MVKVTVELLTSIAIAAAAPAKPYPSKTIMAGIVKWWGEAEAAGIDTANEAAAFLGQACVETDYFKTLREYWGPTAQQLKYDPESKSQLSKDLGNTAKGDGHTYMGRGIFQNTGKANYAKLSELFGIDFVKNPELLETPEWSMKCAVAYWNEKNLGKYAITANFIAVGRGINRGNPKSKSKAYHEAQRINACNKALTLLGKPAAAAIVMENPPSPYKGDQVVFYVQTLLKKKGWYEVGDADGLMGKRTEGAILAYRNEHDPTLPYVTSIDQELVDALETGPDRTVSVTRAETTAADLREAGDTTLLTVATQNKAVAAGGVLSLFGGASDGGITDKAKQALSGAGTLREMGEQGVDLIQWAAQHWWIALLLICGFLYLRNRKLVAERVEAHRVGKNMGV